MGVMLEDLPPRVPDSHLVNVVVDTPAGSRSKFKFDERLGLFRLHKRLPVGAAFPFDFGFVPGTRAADGDAVDVMIVEGEPTFTGCLITVRLLGVLEAEQTEGGHWIRNDRLIGIAETPKIHPEARSLNDLPAGLLDQIEQFFTNYNRAEGREFRVLQRRGPRVAGRHVDESTHHEEANRRTALGGRRGSARRRRTAAAG